jgi:uncharacterized protein (TIGR03067 family)
MRQQIRTATVLAFLSLLPAVVLADDAPKTGDKDLEGSWELKSVVRDGKEQPPPPVDLGKAVMTFKGETLAMTAKDDSKKAAFTVDPTKKPRTIDIVAEDGPDKGKTLKGIYEVKDDELRMCIADAGKDRPTELAAKEGSGCGLMTLKRVKK